MSTIYILFSIQNGGEEMAELREMIKQEQSERKDEAGKMDNYFRYCMSKK